ncbi:serine protease 55-like [Babylonia areolata]|uniref:serine protease 55-like n=1 Tax=Babylonia areolata TaxID=304850 RepID=UPI003FD1A7E2
MASVTLTLLLTSLTALAQVTGHHHLPPSTESQDIPVRTVISWICRLLTRLGLHTESLCERSHTPHTTPTALPPTEGGEVSREGGVEGRPQSIPVLALWLTQDFPLDNVKVATAFHRLEQTLADTTEDPCTGTLPDIMADSTRPEEDQAAAAHLFLHRCPSPPPQAPSGVMAEKMVDSADMASVIMELTNTYPRDNPSVAQAYNHLQSNIASGVDMTDLCTVILPQLVTGQSLPATYQAAAGHIFLETCPEQPPTSPPLTSDSWEPIEGCGESEALWRRRFGSRIVGGNATGTCDVIPWQVRLSSGLGLCGGSIVTDRHILTAAHCVYELRHPSHVKVVTGDYDTRVKESTEKEREVLRVTIHEKYNTNNYANDIAVLTLKEPLDLSDNPCVKPVCRDPSFNPDSHLCTVSGWGTTAAQGKVSPLLQMVDVVVHSGHKCREKFGIPRSHGKYLSNEHTQICAGKLFGGGDSCQGDSGGPLVCLHPQTKTFVQVGVVSYGLSCAVQGFPGVYSNMAAFHHWLQQVIADV